MGIFSKRKSNADEFNEFHNEDLFNDTDDTAFSVSNRPKVSSGSTHIPLHALTKGEVNGEFEDIPMSHTPQPDSVYKRLKEREAANDAIADDYVPSWANTSDKTKSSVEDVHSEKSNTVAEPTKPVVPEKQPEPAYSTSTDAFLEKCRIAVEKASSEAPHSIAPTAPSNEVEQIKVSKAAQLPKQEEAHTRTPDELIRMLRGESVEPSKPAEQPKSEISEENSDEQPDTGREIKVNVEVIPTDSASDIMHTDASGTAPNTGADSDVKVYGKIVRGAVIQQTPDGDVQSDGFVRAPKVTSDTIVADDKTVMFGDLDSIISKRAEDDAKAANFDFNADYGDEDEDDYLETPYYETEDPRLNDIDDYKSLNDAARLTVALSDENSKNKNVSFFSLGITLLLLLTSTGVLSFLPAVTVAVVELILLAATVVLNIDIFKDFKNLKSLTVGFDSCVAVSTGLTLLQNILSVTVFDGKYCGYAAAAAVLLTVNRFSKLMKSSRILKGLKLISTSEPKRAVVSVSGSNANVISSGATDDALALCDRETVNIQNYLKNCGYSSPMDRKIKTLLISSVAIAFVVGIAVGFIKGLGSGLSAASTLLCCFFPAAAALVCELPMYLASKKANAYGAMLVGYKGAYELNLANIVAVTSSDLFPEGSVKLYNMKTLGENELGHTIHKAAAVAIKANSPLSSIFKEMLGNTKEDDLPKVNGVQYEDKMGISGWIGEETILIGNRNLMQGHSVPVPQASVDQKILKAGYFPVYIAIGGVPCLLFMVKYEADPTVKYELQQLCNTGMTVVVDPKDPNTTDAMICDYFGLPNDALKVMNHNGRVSYERTTAKTDSASAPAAFKDTVCGFFSAVTSAIKLNGIYAVLTAVFIIASALGIILTGYLLISGKSNLVTPLTVSAFQILFAAVSAVIAKIKS